MVGGAAPAGHWAAARLAGALGAFVASLCCAGPLLLAALGVLSIPAAGALGLTLFYDYWWAFVAIGLAVAGAALTVYFRSRGICTLDHARRRRREIQSAALAAVLIFLGVYFIWDFVIVEYLGIRMGLWPNPFGRF